MNKNIVFLFIFIFLFSCKEEEKKAARNTTVETTIPPQIATQIANFNKDTTNIPLQLKLIETLDSAALYKQALFYLDKIITTDSLNNAYWFKRGKICNNLHDTAAAIKSFSYAAKIYPTPIALQELANLFAETKNPKTINICNDLIKMNPGGNYNAAAYFFMGVYYSKINDKQKAITLFDKSIYEDYHLADAYIEKGYILYTNKDYKKALEIFKQLNTFNQANADGYYWQAKCNEALNNKKDAIDLYKKALQLDPNINEANDAIKRINND
jgi:tetratricopeptide (TPR) repeat protein